MGREFLVRADGGARGNPGAAAFGAVVYENGKVIKEIFETIGIASNNVAEYRGLIAGLNAVHSLDPNGHILVEMDSKLVIEQMSGNWKIKHPDMRTLAKQARDIHDPKLIKYKWIPRGENSAADALVNQALDGEVAKSTPHRVNFLTERFQTSDLPTTIYFVRHGETILTPQRRFSGIGEINPELTEIGQSQAQSVAEEIAKRKPEFLIASPLRRTTQTAEAISRETGLKIDFDPIWLECNFGLWDGLTHAQVIEEYGEEYKRWTSSVAYAPPQGESYEEVTARVQHGLSNLVSEYPAKTVVVVTHNMTIRCMVATALGAPIESIFHMDVYPCSITTLNIWPSDGLIAVRTFSERGHLPNF